MAQPAARFSDPIGHMSTMARLARVGLNIVTGLAEAALLGAVLFFAAPVALGLTFCAAMLVGGAIASFIAGATDYGEWKRHKIDDAVSGIGSPDITGQIVRGSSNVLINNKGAARAGIDFTDCAKHIPPPPPVAQGSDSVFINTHPAARKQDKVACNAWITEGSPNVFVGGGTTTVCKIADDTELWEIGLTLAIGLLLTPGSAGARFACLGANIVVGLAANYLGRGFRAVAGYPVNPATGGKFLPREQETDFVLPGPLPIEWQRFYNSCDHRRDGLLGEGWSIGYDIELRIARDPDGQESVTWIDFQGRDIIFPGIAPGQSVYGVVAGAILGRSLGGHYQIQTLDHRYYLFGPAADALPAQTLKLRRIEDMHGNWIALRYDRNNRLCHLADSIGRLLVIDYRGDSLRADAVRMTHAAPGEQAGMLVQYRHSPDGQLAEVIDRSGSRVRHFVYQDRLMVEHGYATGFTCHYEWETVAGGPEGNRRVLQHWTSDGERYRFAYHTDEDGSGVTRATDQLDRLHSWTWDRHTNLTGYCDPLGRTWTLEWNADRKLTRATGPTGNVLQYDYDTHGFPIAEIDPLGRRTTTAWDDRWAAPLHVTQSDGGVWRYTYNDAGSLVCVIDPAGNTTDYVYDPRGLPTLVTDAKGGRKRLDWNARAQLIAYTDCSGKTTRHEYDGRNDLTVSIDALGQSTRYVHDAGGRLVSMALPDGSHRQYAYSPAGQLTHATDALNRMTRFQYNERGQLMRRDDPAGRHIKCSYDRAHRLDMLVNENNQAYRFAYDPADRLAEEIRVDGTRRQLEYGLLGLPTAVVEHPGDGDAVEGHAPAQAIRIELQRDNIGRLTEKRLPDAHVRYRYDRMDRLQEATQQSTDGQLLHTSRFGYGPLGELIEEAAVDAVAGTGSLLHHRHDALGNRIATILPDGRTLNHLYYGSGHLHQINLDGALIADVERDDLHREVLRTQGRLTSRYAYDPLSRKAAVWTQPSILKSEALNPHDPAWERTLDQPGSGDILLKHYRYDSAGELRHIRHKLNGQTQHRYDETGRIESTIGSIRQADEFFYTDPAGNRITAQEKHEGWGQVRNNRVKVMGDRRFDYDGFGRTIRKRIGAHTVQHFKYDSQHRMIAAAVIRTNTPDGAPLRQVFQYRYDALGRRIAKQDAFGETAFVWEGMRLLQEKRGGQATTYVYEPRSYVPLARIDGTGQLVPHPSAQFALGADPQAKLRSVPPTNPGWDDAFVAVAPANEGASQPPAGDAQDTARIYYFHNQPNGLPEELSDQDGTLVWRAVYKTWGAAVGESWYAVEAQAGPDARPQAVQKPDKQQNLRMQGQYLDRETGLHYNTFRYYDPDIGRFTTQDPIGLTGGMNLYQYAPNPLDWIDPWGWTPEGVFIHYTDLAGMEKVLKNGALLPNASGKVYVTDILMTPKDVMTNIFIDNPRYAGRGEYAIIFKVDPGTQITQSSYLEYIHEGKLKLGEVIHAGKNPYDVLSGLEYGERLNLTSNQVNSRKMTC